MPKLDEKQAAQLLALARAAIGQALGGPPLVRPRDASFARQGATFVTLYRGEVLHGCIGSLEAHRPLLDDIIDNAVAAALRDPRAVPLSLAAASELRIEISLLSPQERVPCHDEASALSALRPGQDGVVLRCGSQRATFLPQVWEALPDGHEFLRQLRWKAGLDPERWPRELEVYRYSVEKLAEAAAPSDRKSS